MRGCDVTQVLRHNELKQAGEIEVQRFLQKKAERLQKVVPAACM